MTLVSVWYFWLIERIVQTFVLIVDQYTVGSRPPTYWQRFRESLSDALGFEAPVCSIAPLEPSF